MTYTPTAIINPKGSPFGVTTMFPELAYYPIQEASGATTSADVVAGGTLAATGVTYGSAGPFGATSATFTGGTGSHLNGALPTAIPTGSGGTVMMAAWVNVSSLAGANDQYWICSGDQGTSNGWASYIQHSTGDLGVYSFGNTAPVTSIALTTNTWTRIMCGWATTSSVSFYVNGLWAASLLGITYSAPTAFLTVGNLRQSGAYSTSGLVGSATKVSAYPISSNGSTASAYELGVLAWSDYVTHRNVN